MPEHAPARGMRGEDLRIVSVYNQIDSKDFFDLRSPADQDLILAEFVGRETYVTRDNDDESIKGVLLYAPRTEPFVAEIVGLAVDAPYRSKGVGSFLVARMAEISHGSRLKAIDVIAVESAREFLGTQRLSDYHIAS